MPSARRAGAGDRPDRPGKRKDVHERALGLLAVRQRSRRELERRLVQAGFDAEAVQSELGRLEDVGLIDDAAFAAAVVESRMGARGESRRAVGIKLQQAGVDRELALAALDQAPEGEQDRADRLAEARASRVGGLDPATGFARISGFLMRRGYPPGVARQAARRALGVEGIEA
ncbi:MAG TPA: regulatory protein RecX [Actinomycetota bacterium]|nr:regulatory protein RecX [Actinomycetota bacterium]